MQKIKVLDCTLRDGGYCNNWEFGNDNIRNIIQSIENAKVDIAIVNLLNNNSDHFEEMENELYADSTVNYTIIDIGGKNSITNYYSNAKGEKSVNELKTVIISPGFNKFVTGITLTEDGSISIGRKRKRLIFSLTHKFSLDLLEPDKISYLRGLLSFAFSIEPILKKRLEKKYGFHVMNKLLKS